MSTHTLLFLLPQEEISIFGPRIVTDYVIGLGIFPALSLANHSCEPSATVVTCQTGSLMMSLRFIPKGGEVTLCYAVSHLRMARGRRRALLQEGYHFLCQCRACENDWPLLEDLSREIWLICLQCSQPLCILSVRCRNCNLDYSSPLTKKEAIRSNTYFSMDIIEKIELAKQNFLLYANPPTRFNNNEKEIICDLLRLLDKYTVQPMHFLAIVRKILEDWAKGWAVTQYFR